MGGCEVGLPGWVEDGELGEDFGIGAVEGDGGAGGVGLDCPGCR